MSTSDLLEPLASDQEAEMAKVAQRCLIAALDHSRAQRIALVDEKGEITDAPVLELPPQALRFFAEMLGMNLNTAYARLRAVREQLSRALAEREAGTRRSVAR